MSTDRQSGPKDVRAEDLKDWVTPAQAAKLHPHLSDSRIRRWIKDGVWTKEEPKVHLFLPPHHLGAGIYVSTSEVLDFLSALEPGADPELLDRFSR